VGGEGKAQDSAMLHILLNRYYSQVADIAEYVPKDLRATFQSQPVDTSDPLPLLRQPAQHLDSIHYSWLTTPISALPEPLQAPTIAALSSTQRLGVCRLLKRPDPAAQPSPDFRDFLLDAVVRSLKIREQTPPLYLPTSPLNPLATYSKAQLQRLIDLLGVRDLAQEMRMIVNKAHQKKLLESLNEEEQRFFDFYLYKEPERLSIQRLDLKTWDGDAAKLRQQLHIRGLGRLGRAMIGQNAALIWHVSHILDTGRAVVIARNAGLSTTENVRLELQRQVIGIINYLNKHE
jgi:hypothetical protein